MTRGLELNNPLNVMQYSSIKWMGEIFPSSDPKGRLAQFNTPEAGLRAGIKNLMNQQILHGLNTWTSIITKLSPPFENNTKEYIDYMANKTGIAANDPLDLTNPDLLETAARCVIMQEQGTCPFSDDEIAAAVAEVIPPTEGVQT